MIADLSVEHLTDVPCAPKSEQGISQTCLMPQELKELCQQEAWKQKQRKPQSTWSLWHSPRGPSAQSAEIPAAARGTRSSPPGAPGAGRSSSGTAPPAGGNPVSSCLPTVRLTAQSFQGNSQKNFLPGQRIHREALEGFWPRRQEHQVHKFLVRSVLPPGLGRCMALATLHDRMSP